MNSDCVGYFRRSCYPTNYTVTNKVTDLEVLGFGLDLVKVLS